MTAEDVLREITTFGLCDFPYCYWYKGHSGLHRNTHNGFQVGFPWPATISEAAKMRLNNEMTSEEYAYALSQLAETSRT